MNWFIPVGLTVFACLAFGFVIWDEFRMQKKLLLERSREVLSEIKDDKKLLSIVQLMLKNNGLTVDEIIRKSGSELEATVIIDKLCELGVIDGLSFQSIVYQAIVHQEGTKFFISSFWLDTIRALEKRNWDIDRLKIVAKTVLPI